MTGTTMLSINYLRNSYGIVTEQDVKKAGLKLQKDARDAFKGIEGNNAAIDTPEEYITAVYFSPIKIEDASALAAIESELPQSDPKTAGLKLGTMWYQKYIELKFIDPSNTQQLANYDLAMKTICDRTGVSRAEITEFFNKGVAGEVATTVDREFNTISFVLTYNKTKDYNAILTRNNTDNAYTLKYEGYFGDAKATKELIAASLDALVTAMAKSPDFNAACIEKVQRESAMIPGMLYSDWAKLGMIPSPLQLIKDTITSFYTNPSATTYRMLIRVGSLYGANLEKEPYVPYAKYCFTASLLALSSRLGNKYVADITSVNYVAVLQKEPLPDKYRLLVTPYGIGGGQ